jgi:hypothetical protein
MIGNVIIKFIKYHLNKEFQTPNTIINHFEHVRIFRLGLVQGKKIIHFCIIKKIKPSQTLQL